MFYPHEGETILPRYTDSVAIEGEHSLGSNKSEIVSRSSLCLSELWSDSTYPPYSILQTSIPVPLPIPFHNGSTPEQYHKTPTSSTMHSSLPSSIWFSCYQASLLQDTLQTSLLFGTVLSFPFLVFIFHSWTPFLLAQTHDGDEQGSGGEGVWGTGRTYIHT